MRQSEIKAGSTYEGTSGGRRKILRIFQKPQFPNDPLTVSYQHLIGKRNGKPIAVEDGVPVYRCSVTSFASWAEREIES